MDVKRSGSEPSKSAPAEHFVGTVRLDSPFVGTEPASLGGALVTFEPGARSNWHTHPLGQFLIVTAGRGWAQSEGGPIETIYPGDIIWFAPEEKHWHGATTTTAMSHLAFQERRDGHGVTWLEPVSQEAYEAAESSK